MTAGELQRLGAVALVTVSTVPAFGRVFADTGWRTPALLAAGVVLASTLLLRLARQGPLVTTTLSALAAVLTVPWLAGVLERPGLPIGERRIAIAEVWAQGLEELALTPAPAPSLTGLVLVVTAGFAVVALAATVMSRQGRGELALLPIVLLWAVPLAIPAPAGRVWPTVVPFLLAVVVLLLVTARDPATGLDGGVASVGLGLGAAATALAVLVPGVLPGYDAPAWVAIGGGGEPRGYQPIVDISERLRLPEERDVLRVAASQRSYLRLAGLDTFDGNTWRLGEAGQGSYRPDPEVLYPATGALPPEAPAARTERVFVDVEVLALDNIYVPTPYQPVEVLGPTRAEMVWSTDGGFLATWDTTDLSVGGSPRIGVREGVTYRVEAERPAPSFADLVAAEEDGLRLDDDALARWTQLPRSYAALGDQAEEIYAAAGAVTDVERALALQDWFTGPDGGFAYDLDVPALRGEDALQRFVLEDKVGYCEYFATAMAVMLRETGVPARVAVGFLPGEVTLPPDPDAGRELTEYTVSTSDAHAWVEVLFPEHGWVTFEPTPRDDDTQIVPRTNDLAPTENERERRQRELEERIAELEDDQPVPDTPDLSDPEAATPELPEDSDASVGGGVDAGGGRGILLALLVLVGGAVAVTAGWLVLRQRRAGRTSASEDARGRVLAAQRRLLTRAQRYGVGRHRNETLPELVARWEREGRVDERAERIVPTVQAAAFGGEVGVVEAVEVDQLVGELEDLLQDSVSGRDRMLAPVRVPLDRARATLRQVLRRRSR
jgi:transglutaminase-like putative cysteine protease